MESQKWNPEGRKQEIRNRNIEEKYMSFQESLQGWFYSLLQRQGDVEKSHVISMR